MEKISVIIPVYNVELYLRDCLDSVLNQTQDGIEVICINDASTDSSCEILNEYLAAGKRIKVIDNQKNMGLSAARNIGMEQASGKYIYFLDSDDMIRPQAMECLYQAAEKDGTDIVFFDSLMIFEHGGTSAAENMFAANHVYPEIMQGAEFLELMRRNNDIREPVWLQFWNRRFLERIRLRYYEGIFHEDLLFTYESLMEAKRVKCINKQLHFYRIRKQAITNIKVSEKHIAGLLKTYTEIFSLWNLKYKGKEDLASEQYLIRIQWKINQYLDQFMDKEKINRELGDDRTAKHMFRMILNSKNLYDEYSVTVIVLGDCSKERLNGCISSILCQTYSVQEILVVLKEDSPIGEKDIAEYENPTVNVIFCEKESNLTEMFHAGLERVYLTSGYSVCIDGNDWIGADYINTMHKEAVEKNCDVLCGGTICIPSNPDDSTICNVTGACWNKLYRRNIDWQHAKEAQTLNGNYFRRIRDFKYCECEKKYDWRYDNLKTAVLSSKYDFISFDIFDTLVQRPFYRPEDLFLLLDAEFEKYMHSSVSFSIVRQEGEAQLRQKYAGTDKEDVTIDEIYENIGRMFGISESVADVMKRYEKNLEIRYAQTRKAVKEIYDLVIDAGKKVIFISDMYLDRQTIQEILIKNGYTKYEKMYLSSECGKLKVSGRLYDYVMKDLQILPRQILHIGDNKISDIDAAKKRGLEVYHIPKAIDVFTDPWYQKGVKTCDEMTKELCGALVSYEKIESSTGYRCMLAQAANKYFDNPYRHYLPDTVFNQDPYFIGYYLLGMYLAGLNQWIDSIVTQNAYHMIYFTSRDGWMPMEAYNILRKVKPQLPCAEYFYTSREALLPAIIREQLDFYDLPIDPARYSPKKLFWLLRFFTRRSEEEWKERCQKNGMMYEEPFENHVRLNRITGLFVKEFYDKQKHEESIENIRPYYARLDQKCILFDSGYSGRIQNAVSYLAGEEIDVMYIHSDTKSHDLLSRRGGFKIFSYYDFFPQMPTVFREYMMSAPAPSCNGYQMKNGVCHPVFDECIASERELETLRKMQNGAREFLEDFYGNFGDLLAYVPYKSFEVSLPLESFYQYGLERDKEFIYSAKFDDMVFGADRCMELKNLV